jgi:thioesterase domain-containing protein
MTKPANFPERKRQRRLRALARLKANKTSGREADHTIRVLIERAVEGGSQRDDRTKKHRGVGLGATTRRESAA